MDFQLFLSLPHVAHSVGRTCTVLFEKSGESDFCSLFFCCLLQWAEHKKAVFSFVRWVTFVWRWILAGWNFCPGFQVGSTRIVLGFCFGQKGPASLTLSIVGKGHLKRCQRVVYGMQEFQSPGPGLSLARVRQLPKIGISKNGNLIFPIGLEDNSIFTLQVTIKMLKLVNNACLWRKNWISFFIEIPIFGNCPWVHIYFTLVCQNTWENARMRQKEHQVKPEDNAEASAIHCDISLQRVKPDQALRSRDECFYVASLGYITECCWTQRQIQDFGQGAQWSFDPRGGALSLIFSPNRGFPLKIDWKLHDSENQDLKLVPGKHSTFVSDPLESVRFLKRIKGWGVIWGKPRMFQ